MSKLVITKEREKRNWTQIYVASELGTTKQSVCNWEKGRSFPRKNILDNLETLFNLTHRELFAPAKEEDPFSQ